VIGALLKVGSDGVQCGAEPDEEDDIPDESKNGDEVAQHRNSLLIRTSALLLIFCRHNIALTPGCFERLLLFAPIDLVGNLAKL
jgi:hypothetical protein